MSTDTKDLKVDAELRDIAEDVANDVYGQDFGSIKAMSHEAVIVWLLVRADDAVVDQVLDRYGYDSRTDLIDAIADRQFSSKYALEFDPLAAIHYDSNDDSSKPN